MVFRSFTLEINARHVSEANILPDSMDWLTSLAPCAKIPTGTEGVVPDLGVPHVVIRRQTDGCSVCLEFDHGIGRHRTVQRGRVCGATALPGGPGASPTPSMTSVGQVPGRPCQNR